MKNIHLLPTDKPSRLVKFFTNKFHLCKEILPIQDEETYQNIYITSDEEIKEGDWMYYKHFGEDIVCKYNTMNGQNTNVNEHKPYYQKIILTTYQDLIKYGVQCIDDEFLEWFVKNPSCESVEAVKEYKDGFGNWYLFQEKLFSDHFEPFALRYKIIIPQEETKQDYSKIKEGLKKSIEGKAHFIQHFKNGGTVEEFKPLESKQETLEEAAEKYAEPFDNRFWVSATFKDGAKWQQERMYSEEDMINFHKWAYQKNRIEESDKTTKELLKEWFEQFKKK